MGSEYPLALIALGKGSPPPRPPTQGEGEEINSRCARRQGPWAANDGDDHLIGIDERFAWALT